MSQVLTLYTLNLHATACQLNLINTSQMMQWSRICLGRKDRLEKEMTIHSNGLVWKISRMGEPGRLQSMGSQS